MKDSTSGSSKCNSRKQKVVPADLHTDPPASIGYTDLHQYETAACEGYLRGPGQITMVTPIVYVDGNGSEQFVANNTSITEIVSWTLDQ